MNSINILMDEHQNILKLTELLEKYSGELLENNSFNMDTFRFMVEFGRVYGDKLHHQKEEEILFKEMEDTLGPTAHKLIRTGMYVEHDLGRLYLSNIESALNNIEDNGLTTASKLDVIGNSIAYRDLLKRHIDKEDDAVYTFAINNLSDESKEKVESLSNEFDNQDEIIKLRANLLEKLNSL